MKIIFLTSRFPYPLEKGDKLRAFNQIIELSESHEIHLISISEDDVDKTSLEKLREYTSSMFIIRITPFERFVSLFQSVTSGLPFQIAWFYSNSINKIISDRIIATAPDHIFCQLPRMAEYCMDLPYKKTLDYMDSFGIGMKRRAAVARGLTSIVYKLEASRMIRYEARIAGNFDNLTIISKQDKDLFTFEKSKEIIVLNNGISADYFSFEGDNSKKYDLVFVGNMSYLPNIEAVEYLTSKIIPLFHYKLKVLIAGANPHRRIRKLAHENIKISGWVEDIRTAYASAKIFVAPIWSGTGQQNKILEAMAMGTPCITTAAVNNAIGATPGKEILLAETPESFAEAIELLLSDSNLYTSISKNSVIYVRQNFDWKQNGKILSSIFAQN